MNLKITFSAFVLLFSICFISCQKRNKQAVTHYQTIDITLDMNKGYQYNFGAINANASVTRQAQAFLVSELDKVNNSTVFNYTPKLNFAGSDVVEITLEENNEHTNNVKSSAGNCQNNASQNCSKNHNGCNKSNTDKTIYTFKFTINQTQVAATKVAVKRVLN